MEHEFEDLAGMAILEGYGMTEMGICTINPPAGLNKPGTVGPANIGVELSIRDDDGREVGTGNQGRLWVKSPTNTVGYWENPGATAEVIVDGWLDTGDIVAADDAGYLSFFGRKKQIIVHDGSNISPQEVEDSLLEHPAVCGAGVVGVHDLVHGENVWAYVALRDGVEPPAIKNLIEFSRDRIGYKAPDFIELLSDIPMNASGKVDRSTLKRWAADRHKSEAAG